MIQFKKEYVLLQDVKAIKSNKNKSNKNTKKYESIYRDIFHNNENWESVFKKYDY